MTSDQTDWLALEDRRDPAEWLAWRAGPPADASRLRALLAETARHYEETPRMIANRVAQISDQVADAAPPDLLADFAFDPSGSRSFGAVAQQYLVLRRQGLDHPRAVATLRAEAGEYRG